MDIEIEKVTVTADKDKRLDENWTVEFDDTEYSYSDENWTVEIKDGVEFWHRTDLADDLFEILIDEVLKDKE